MAHISRLSDFVDQGVAQDTIPEGRFVTISTSGIRNELKNVRLAASGSVYPVFVAMVSPTDLARPYNANMLTAGRLTVIRLDVNTGYADPIDAYTMYRRGLESLENPVITSGMLVQLHRGTTVTLTTTGWVDVANIRVPGALVKVADDGTGRAQYTALQSEAIGFVEEYDSTRGYLTITLKQ